MEKIFLNPQTLAKINAETDALVARWDVPADERFWVYQMVATIELGVAEKVFRDGDGITFDGWNGYRGIENSCRDPRRAYGGFYRQERNQMAGWSAYLIDRADDKVAQAERCTNAYGFWFVWEEEPMVWGFRGWQDFYTEAERDEAADRLEGLAHVKRLVRHPESEFSGCFRLEAWTTRQKPGLRNEWRERVPAKAS